MADELKLMFVAAARPNFMKVAPLLKAVARRNATGGAGRRFRSCLVHTGQHYDAKMSDIFFTELGIAAPDVNLEVGSGSHAVQTAKVQAANPQLNQDQAAIAAAAQLAQAAGSWATSGAGSANSLPFTNPANIPSSS